MSLRVALAVLALAACSSKKEEGQAAPPGAPPNTPATPTTPPPGEPTTPPTPTPTPGEPARTTPGCATLVPDALVQKHFDGKPLKEILNTKLTTCVAADGRMVNASCAIERANIEAQGRAWKVIEGPGQRAWSMMEGAVMFIPTKRECQVTVMLRDEEKSLALARDIDASFP